MRPVCLKRSRLLQFAAFVGSLGALPGCSGQAVLDQSPIENFVAVAVVNDSARRIEFTRCYNARCSFHDVTDSVAPGMTGKQAFNNGTSSTITLRIVRHGLAPECLVVHSREGQRRVRVYVSAANPCS
jgi:hypothetical protein